MRRSKRERGFVLGIKEYITHLRSEGRYSSAKSYQDALGSLQRFFRGSSIAYTDITKDSLRYYQAYLLEQGRSWNTVSTYIRRIRHIYNVGIERGRAPYVRHLFEAVFTGVESRRKLALPSAEMRRLMNTPVNSPGLRRTQLSLSLMFLYGGMAFVDFAHLSQANLEGGRLDYRRQKTGTTLQMLLPDIASELSLELAGDTSKGNSYIYSFLSGSKQGEEAYREYTSALSRFNRDLRALAKAVGVESPVSSYTIRHTFATTLKELGVSVEVISELMGHKSIKTTQIYLKGFSLERLSAENAACFNSVYQACH